MLTRPALTAALFTIGCGATSSTIEERADRTLESPVASASAADSAPSEFRLTFAELQTFWAIAAGPTEPTCVRWQIDEARQSIETRHHEWDLSVDFAVFDDGLAFTGYSGAFTREGGAGGAGSASSSTGVRPSSVFVAREQGAWRFSDGHVFLSEDACASALETDGVAYGGDEIRAALAMPYRQDSTPDIQAALGGAATLYALLGDGCAEQTVTYVDAAHIRWSSAALGDIRARTFELTLNEENDWRVRPDDNTGPFSWVPFRFSNGVLDIYPDNHFGLCGAELYIERAACEAVARHRGPLIDPLEAYR